MLEFLCMVGVIVINLGFCVVILYRKLLKIFEKVGLVLLFLGKLWWFGLNLGML